MSRMSKPLCNAFSSGDHPVLLAAALLLPMLARGGGLLVTLVPHVRWQHRVEGGVEGGGLARAERGGGLRRERVHGVRRLLRGRRAELLRALRGRERGRLRHRPRKGCVEARGARRRRRGLALGRAAGRPCVFL